MVLLTLFFMATRVTPGMEGFNKACLKLMCHSDAKFEDMSHGLSDFTICLHGPLLEHKVSPQRIGLWWGQGS